MDTFTPGDFILVHGIGFFDRLIQFGQSLRFSKEDSFYNHVALIVSPEGDLIEAVGKGVKQTHISKYQGIEPFQLKIIRVNASEEDRAESVNFAKSCLSEGYGWTTIVSTAFCIFFGLKFSFGFDGQDICSGLVARSLERTPAIFNRDPRHITPADLAHYFLTH